MSQISTAAAIGTGALFGIGAGIAIGDAQYGSLWIFALSTAALTLFVWRFVAPWVGRRRVLELVLFGHALRFAVSVLLYTGIQAVEPGREWITGDDGEYARLAWAYAQYLHGQPELPYVPPHWAGETYLFGTYVYAVAAAFFVFGPSPVVPSVMNSAFFMAAIVFAFQITRRLFGIRPAFLAALLISFFPSMVLWSSINLKEALAGFLVMVAMWALLRFAERPRAPVIGLAYVALWAMESLRRYTFLGLAALIPFGIAVAPRLGRLARLRWSLAAVALSAALLGVSPVANYFGLDIFHTLQDVRVDMGRNARTAFTDLPVTVHEGDTFVVPGAPAPDPTTVIVRPDARIVVAPGRLAAPSPSPGEVVVQPGDLVVISGTGQLPQVTQPPRALPGGGQVLQLGSGAYEAIGIRTLSYLPVGLTYALFAPFPWGIERRLDLLAVPEMLLWYVVFAAAVSTLWTHRTQWRELAPLAAYVAGTMFMFALAEGNVGTLFRHRAMVIPATVVLAAPTLVTVASWRWPARISAIPRTFRPRSSA